MLSHLFGWISTFALASRRTSLSPRMFCASGTLRRRVELDKRFITIDLSFRISLRTNPSSHWLVGQQRFAAACRNPIEPLTSHQLFQTSYGILAYEYVVPLR